jgi:hypothetical protein
MIQYVELRIDQYLVIASKFTGHQMCHAYNTPLVLGTSFPPVLWIASRMASASALNADSALTTSPVQLCITTRQ